MAIPEGFLIIVERINLRHSLERILIPSSVACWLAERWPVWALPAVAWVRLRNRMVWVRHDRDLWVEKFWIWLAWKLPRALAKWAFLRVSTNGEEGNPNDTKAGDALRRWSEKE